MLLTAMTTGKPAMSKITKTLDIQSLRLLLAQIANHFSFEEKVQIFSLADRKIVVDELSRLTQVSISQSTLREYA